MMADRTYLVDSDVFIKRNPIRSPASDHDRKTFLKGQRNWVIREMGDLRASEIYLLTKSQFRWSPCSEEDRSEKYNVRCPSEKGLPSHGCQGLLHLFWRLNGRRRFRAFSHFLIFRFFLSSAGTENGDSHFPPVS